ncbi:TIGR03857 family LLM class F420-dependent oxidoreductase [Halieaceae bacterium IMCC14734]|uniref:TIGR03857 family LLM class F420-dependent oxidoreductase n=1 Tax=Candidatus Litorirhabdus singularis TaxID=2518993 RepID=A0ABT3TEN3_9GAMM|nr:TIGR03857 family LLM class F420-dependent oxidoreductase [Candidatus Litorirhabdus singularis]MCX2980464.1 TIGR03857 family LLM class F420-dependent oxidoreductase [Candidatus Litorirhabdus singularis]
MTQIAEFPELSCYLLPGHTTTPADAIEEARQAEAMGLGKVWLSERFDVKDAGVICAAALTATSTLRVATAATNIHTRHPLVLATMASSLHHLSGGRFELGLARGVAIRDQLMGLKSVTNAQLAEGIELLRALWRGEKVMGHEGAMGNLPYLSMGDWMDAEIPLHFVGFGKKSLGFGGEHFDGVHLHTFITDAGLRRAKSLIQQGANKAGRNPDDVKVWSVYATALNPSREDTLKKLVARMATYMQAPGYAEMLIALNEWDPAVHEAFKASEVVSSMPGGIDSVATLEQLEEISELIPQEWLPAATGSAEECADAWLNQLENGADGIVIHGSTPSEFAPILEAYREKRARR